MAPPKSTNLGERDETLTRLALSDPRGRSQAEWLDILDMLLRRLEETVGSCVEVGSYWFEHGPLWRDYGCATLVARIRAAGPLLGTGSDGWEATLCMTGDERGCGVDVMAFPYLEGSLLTRRGRLADLMERWEVEEFWVTFTERGWDVRGWKPGEGPGEWDGIRAPGDMFPCVLRGRTTDASQQLGGPRLIRIERARGDDVPLGGSAWFSLHRLRRDGEEIVSPQHPSSSDLDGHGDLRISATSETLPTTFALDPLRIPRGWIPGRYRAEVRLTYASKPGVHESDVSMPFEFEVT